MVSCDRRVSGGGLKLMAARGTPPLPERRARCAGPPCATGELIGDHPFTELAADLATR